MIICCVEKYAIIVFYTSIHRSAKYRYFISILCIHRYSLVMSLYIYLTIMYLVTSGHTAITRHIIYLHLIFSFHTLLHKKIYFAENLRRIRSQEYIVKYKMLNRQKIQ